MAHIYKAITYRQEFVAFWKRDEKTISLFLPSGLGEVYFSRPLEEWDSARTHYADREKDDLDQYDDIVNAAWHFLGHKSAFLDKRTAALSDVQPGIYYPRIWRGYCPDDNPYIGYNAVNLRREYGYKYIQSAVAASSLFGYLTEIFRHVEPAKENLSTFGHKTRELLLLACMEIESGWRAVLDENTKQEKRQDRYTTADYFRIKEPLHLGEWSVILTDYPQLNAFTPFAKWTSTSPTQSLQWYDAYNAVKHHREARFSQATLQNLLNAMSALHIMQVAQWGPEVFSFLHENRFSPFTVVKSPDVGMGEIYMPAIDESGSLTPDLYFDR
jgi:hypothetical protein